MLDKVELLVAGRGPEIVAIISKGFLRFLSLFADDSLGAVAELERSLIVERVRAGLRNARAKGKTLGRPRKIVDAAKIAALRAQGRSWRDIAREVGTNTASARRAVSLM